jgi:CHAT domain-containing protein
MLTGLYQVLIAPIEGWLPADGATLVIEPDDVLWMLPFAALRGPDGRDLIDRWNIHFVPSLTVIDELRRDARPPLFGAPPAFLIGDPAMPPVPHLEGLSIELGALPGAREEVKRIAALFPRDLVDLRVGEEATKAAYLEEARQFGVIHLATHGIAYPDNPLGSFVALAASDGDGGLLTALEVMDRPIEADLVVLSACQTGLGRLSSDGMIGLTRSFLVAGARSILVSLWSIDDQATVPLMEAFYRRYLRDEHHDKAAALREAMLELRAQPRFASPSFWAPFMLVGAAQ